MFGIYRSLPTNRSNVNAIKSVDAARFTEGTPPKGFCPIDDQPKRFEVINDELGSLGRDYDVITEHEYSTGLMKPMIL
jgi:hypothetical protein